MSGWIVHLRTEIKRCDVVDEEAEVPGPLISDVARHHWHAVEAAGLEGVQWRHRQQIAVNPGLVVQTRRTVDSHLHQQKITWLQCAGQLTP